MLKRGFPVIATSVVIAAPVAAQDEPENLSIVSSGDAQTQPMAVVLSLQAAIQGMQPRILRWRPVGDLALADAPAADMNGQPPRGASPRGLMRRLINDFGETAEVRANYPPGRGEDASVPTDRVGVADLAEIAALIANPANRAVGY